ncbi:Hint domain-containing protein [Marivita sp. S0852]|uniref:Hint domain-containing protein n=1 Tax=Marivita sp. S0852 TaxID=3373893 RepID=UPI003981F364
MPDTLLGGIAINEVLVDPNGPTNNFDTDGNGAARGRDEFLELVNLSNTAIDISGLELWDQGRDNWFTFPPGTILEAGAVAVVVRDVQNGGSLPAVTGDNLAFDADYNRNVFNNGGDNIVVYDPANDEYIQATYNGDALLDPTTSSGFSGFSSTATRSGSSEDFGNDIDGISIQRLATGFTNSEPPTPGSLICFATDTLIETESGQRPVQDLRAGDLVRTLDSGVQPIVWVFGTPVSQRDMARDRLLRPVVLPCIDGFAPLSLSRQHRVVMSGKTVSRMFGHSAVLVPAKDLLSARAVRQNLPRHSIAYYHILLNGHHILNANGYAVESLFAGPQARDALSWHARQNLRACRDREAARVLHNPCPPARPFASGAKAQRLVLRHEKNARPIGTRFSEALADYRTSARVTAKVHTPSDCAAQQLISRQVQLGCTRT